MNFSGETRCVTLDRAYSDVLTGGAREGETVLPENGYLILT